MNKDELEQKRKEQIDIQTYFKFHPKKSDKLKPKLVKLNKQISEEIAEDLLEKYNVQ